MLLRPEAPALACCLALIAAAPLAAADVRLHCAALDATPEADLTYAGDTLTVVENGFTATLEARLDGEPPENYSISGAGEGQALLPEAGAMDACLTDALKTNGAAASDADAVAYAVNTCRLDLAAKAVAQQAELAYQIIIMAPDPAQLFVTRTYTTPSAVTGAPIAIPEWPMRSCEPAS